MHSHLHRLIHAALADGDPHAAMLFELDKRRPERSAHGPDDIDVTWHTIVIRNPSDCDDSRRAGAHSGRHGRKPRSTTPHRGTK
jgi:hypothetical protein